jgi:predicted phage tail protein
MNQHRMPAFKRALAAVVAAAAILGAQSGAALADSSASTLPPAWHIHDGQTGLGAQHKGIGFFPTILGISTATYLLDPASCPNATDKAFLPSAGSSASEVLRAGVCMTSTQVIQLRTVPIGVSGPEGWSSLSGTDGGGYVTYYQVINR